MSSARRAPARFRSIFVSDVHLGSPRSQAELLVDFLTCTDAEFLYLVGDIVDDGRSPRHEGWPAAHRQVLELVRHKATSGTLVRYLPGNHDGPGIEAWGWCPRELEVLDDHLHLTADGKRLWVIHGDRFDGIHERRRWAGRLGDALTRVVERLCAGLAALLGGGAGHRGQRLKQLGKHALGYTRRFERSALLAARDRRVDGVICGHVHAPASRVVDGLYYGNGGDWVGSATALVEHSDGRLELLAWPRHA
jgi:UDP-2,3-diacylglucosamine pyrophosphatase LpxH